MKTKNIVAHRDYLEAANDILSLGQALAREGKGEFVLSLPTGEDLRYHNSDMARTARCLLGGYFYRDRESSEFIGRCVRRAMEGWV